MKQNNFLCIAVTGSIGMGKSTVARFFSRKGYVLFNADRATHQLLSPKGAAFIKVCRAFPSVLFRGRICRKKLGDIVFTNPFFLQKLESIIHPLVFLELKKKKKEAKNYNKKGVIVELPLLFERGYRDYFDYVACVYARAAIQKKRVLERPNMTPARYRQIKKNQLSDQFKKSHSDFIIPTDIDLVLTKKIVYAICEQLEDRKLSK